MVTQQILMSRRKEYFHRQLAKVKRCIADLRRRRAKRSVQRANRPPSEAEELASAIIVKFPQIYSMEGGVEKRKGEYSLKGDDDCERFVIRASSPGYFSKLWDFVGSYYQAKSFKIYRSSGTIYLQQGNVAKIRIELRDRGDAAIFELYTC